MKNSERDGNSTPSDFSPEKSVYRTRSNNENRTWNKKLVPNQERSMSKLYIVTLLIYLICRVHHANARLNEAQIRIKIARRNINNLRYADNTTLMAESEEELKRLLMNVKEESEKVGLKLNIQKTKIMASDPITSWQIDRETMETVRDFIFLCSHITADDVCSHEIKRCLLLGRKAMTNLHSILKSRDITLPKKVHLVKAMLFPVVMYRYESWTLKKAEHQRIDAFNLWCWRRLLRVSWTARIFNQSILKEISPEFIGRIDAEAETPILWPPDVKN